MRYYFHFIAGDERLDDDMGIDHADLGEARREALRAAREIVAESLRRDLPVAEDGVIEITDRSGRLVDQVSLVAAAFGATAGQRYRRIFDAAPQPGLLLSTTFVILDANAAFLGARQTDLAAIAGRPLADLFAGAAAGLCGLTASLRSVLRDKVTHELPRQRLDLRRRDGAWEERYWRVLNAPVFDGDGNVEFILHQAEDVTDASAAGPRREAQPASAVSPPASSTS